MIASFAVPSMAADSIAISTPLPPVEKPAMGQAPSWNWHVQNTDIVQGHPGFFSKYSGPNSLKDGSELKETVSLDLFAGARLWHGAEAHVDGLVWQGFGISKTLGVDGFPNGEAFRLGTRIPNANFSRVFVRQTIGLGGEQEAVEDVWIDHPREHGAHGWVGGDGGRAGAELRLDPVDGCSNIRLIQHLLHHCPRAGNNNGGDRMQVFPGRGPVPGFEQGISAIEIIGRDL